MINLYLTFSNIYAFRADDDFQIIYCRIKIIEYIFLKLLITNIAAEPTNLNRSTRYYFHGGRFQRKSTTLRKKSKGRLKLIIFESTLFRACDRSEMGFPSETIVLSEHYRL